MDRIAQRGHTSNSPMVRQISSHVHVLELAGAFTSLWRQAHLCYRGPEGEIWLLMSQDISHNPSSQHAVRKKARVQNDHINQTAAVRKRQDLISETVTAWTLYPGWSDAQSLVSHSSRRSHDSADLSSVLNEGLVVCVLARQMAVRGVWRAKRSDL